MKALLIIPFISVVLVGFSCTDDQDFVKNSEDQLITSQLSNMPIEPLSTAEVNALQFMREEEKLARDVYNYLYSKWNLHPFENISKSEQRHMEAVGRLLDRYNLEDPVATDIPGTFKNQDLQNLYNELTKEGATSKVAALTVGAKIEEIDIRDLMNELANNVDNEDINRVFENLTRGSRNHLRAFVRNLEKYGVSYEPQFLDAELYTSIVEGGMEQGPRHRMKQ